MSHYILQHLTARDIKNIDDVASTALLDRAMVKTVNNIMILLRAIMARSLYTTINNKWRPVNKDLYFREFHEFPQEEFDKLVDEGLLEQKEEPLDIASWKDQKMVTNYYVTDALIASIWPYIKKHEIQEMFRIAASMMFGIVSHVAAVNSSGE